MKTFYRDFNSSFYDREEEFSEKDRYFQDKLFELKADIIDLEKALEQRESDVENLTLKNQLLQEMVNSYKARLTKGVFCA